MLAKPQTQNFGTWASGAHHMPVAKPPAPLQPQYLWWAVVCGHKWQQEKKHWWTAKHEGCERERGGGHSNPLCFGSSVLCDSKFTSAHRVQWVALAWSQGEQVPGHRYSLSAEVGASEWAQGRKHRSRSWVSVSLSFSLPLSLALSLTPSHKHTLPPSLSPHPIPIVCLIRGSFVAGFHTRTPASVAAFFSQGLPCSSVTPSLFNLHGNASMRLCVCVLRVCPPAVCVSEHMHTHAHTHIHIWVKRHAIPSEPGNARDYGKRCDYYQDFYFLLSPPLHIICFRQTLNRPVLAGCFVLADS